MIDFCINTNKSYINDELDLILQQIDILFDTTPNDVLGSENFGSNYDRYLHNLNISNEGLRSQVVSDLSEIEMFGFNYNVDVYFLEATENDIALINITLFNGSDTYEKTYKIV